MVACLPRNTPRTVQSIVAKDATVLAALGGEAGCKRLSAEFYARVGRDPVLRPFFPGKTLKCAIEEFSAFLIQFLGGDEDQTQRRWHLSLRESHARFRLGPAERHSWLEQMRATLNAISLDEATRERLRKFFEHTSAYVIRQESALPDDDELHVRWGEQLALDGAVAAIVAGRDAEAMALTASFLPRPAVFTGLLARIIGSGSTGLVAFVVEAVEGNPFLSTCRSGERTLLHYASGAGCVEVVSSLLRLGTDPGIQDSGGHTPLYCVANQCASETGPEVVRALVRAGADPNACGGVTRATALHMAARRGHVEIARTLLDCGAALELRDSKGDTPLQRAVNCRKQGVVQLLIERGADQTSMSG